MNANIKMKHPMLYSIPEIFQLYRENKDEIHSCLKGNTIENYSDDDNLDDTVKISASILVIILIIGIISFTVATPIQMAIIKASEGSEMLGSSMNQSAFNMGNASGAYLAGIPIAMGFEITAASYVGAALAGMGILIALGIIVNKNSDDIKIKIRRFALK